MVMGMILGGLVLIFTFVYMDWKKDKRERNRLAE